jgi:hypothetical protein
MKLVLTSLLALLLGVGIIVAISPLGHGGGHADAADKVVKPALELVWSREVLSASYISTTRDGSYVATVSSQGKVMCFNLRRGLLWQTKIDGIDQVTVGPDGSAVAYTALDPKSDTAYFIGAKGKVLWHRDVDGAIWSADASGDGRFVIGTGEKYCYVFTVTEKRHRYRRWRVPGAPTSVSFDGDDGTILIGTWQEAGVGRFGERGAQVAWWKGNQDKLYSSEHPRVDVIVATGTPNTRRSVSAVQVLDGSLNEVWAREFALPGLSTDVSRDGGFVAVGYRQVIVHKNKEMSEKRIALYDRGGHRLWEKGGIFGQWNLLQLCSSGRMLLYDESGTICLVSREGDIVDQTALPAKVRRFVRTADRESIVLYLSNGQLCLYRTR